MLVYLTPSANTFLGQYLGNEDGSAAGPERESQEMYRYRMPQITRRHAQSGKCIFMNFSKPNTSFPEVGLNEKKKKKSQTGDLGCKYPFLGICDASQAGNTDFSKRETPSTLAQGKGPDFTLSLSRKQESLSFCLREDCRFQFSWRWKECPPTHPWAQQSPQNLLKVWRACFSSARLRVCMWGVPGSRRLGPRASGLGVASRALVHCLCCAYGVRSRARNNSLLRQSRAVPTGSVRGGSPSSVLEEPLLTDCWGPFNVNLRVEHV